MKLKVGKVFCVHNEPDNSYSESSFREAVIRSLVNVKSSAPCQIMRRCSLAALTVTFSWKFFRPWHDRLQHCFIYIPVFIFSLYQLCQQISDIIINIQVIRTGCLRDAVNDRTCLRSSNCIDCHPVFPANCKIPKRSFTG